jgi:hypothetical protein
MRDIMPTEPAPGWKQSSTTAATDAPLAPWRRAAPAARSGARFARRVTLLTIWVAFLTLCTALVWVATWVSPPRDVALFILSAGYEDNVVFPPDCAGLKLQRELVALARTSRPSKGQAPTLLRLVQDRVHELRTDAPWDRGLAFQESTLLMVVTGHGGADTLGAYVIPTDADARSNARHRLRVTTILDRLDKLPPAIRVVLVFDVTQLPAHWAVGMVHNDFAHAIKGLEKRIASRPNLVVLLSSGESQLSTASHELGKTIFGHAFVEALRGAADRDGKAKLDTWELYRYTSERVTRWSRANRAAVQTPMILPANAEERARNIILNVGTMPASPPPPEPTLATAWTEAWRDWQQMRATVPYVAAPHLWQQYQTCALHHELALRFNDSATAGRKRQQMVALAAAIDKARQVRLASSDATLPMHQLAASTTMRDEALEKFFARFWDAPTEEEARTLWEDAKKDQWKDRPLPVRALAAAILERTGREKLAALDRAAQRLRLLRQGDAPLPAEAHWLLMMARDLAPSVRKGPEGDALFALALEVRVHAEQAALARAPRAPEIQPWIEPIILQADEKRLLGQDLLLSSSVHDWQKARTLLLQAHEAYREAETHAAILADAMHQRDRALADLPAYSHWLARRPVLDKPPVADPTFEPSVTQLWQNTHRLVGLLQAPPVAGLEEIKQRADTLRKDVDDLERGFDRFVNALLNSAADERHVWLEAEAALLVPRPDLTRRADLVIRQTKLARRIAELTRVKELPTPPMDAVLTAKRHARREGMMALAALGEAWVNRFPGDKHETFAQIQHRLERAQAEENQEWQKTIVQAGRQIGLNYRKIPAEIERLLTPDAKADLTQHRRDLDAAELLARRMEASLRMPEPLDPVDAARRLRLGMFLTYQTRRCWQEHWYDENPTADPYYRVVGRTFLVDARAQMPSGKRDRWSAKFTDSIGELGKRLEAPGEWTLVETTQRATDVGGRLIPDPW